MTTTNIAENCQIMKQSEIVWKYFFGGSSGRCFDRFYKAEINGIRVEKHATQSDVIYAIGNIDEAKIKYKTENELMDACRNVKK
jgi:hypothetical protein